MSESFDLSELSRIVPQGRVTNDRRILQGFETPERGTRGLSKYLVEPANPSELAAVASWAFRERQHLVIQGANSGLVEGSTPDGSGDQGTLGLGRMSRLIDFNPLDRVAVIESGLRLGELNRILGEANQRFPIEIGADPTIGGLMATNAGGARTIRYGDASSRLIGLEAVIADANGTAIGSPSTLVKDNSRLKLEKVFAGSYGALGVISRLAVRTVRTPRSVAAALVAPTSHHHVLEILASFEQSFDHSVSAFEFISGDTVELARSTTPGLQSPLGPASDTQVLIEVESRTVDIPLLEEHLADQLGRISRSNPQAVVDAVIVPPNKAWDMRHALSEGVMRAGATIRFDISVPRWRLPQLRDFVLARFRSESVMLSEFGHWGDGGTHLALVYPDRNLPQSIQEVRREVYDKVVFEFGGSFSSEHGLGRHNAEFYERYVPESERQVARDLKRLLDPRSVWGTAPFL